MESTGKKLTYEWNVTPAEAIKIQHELRQKLDLTPFNGKISYIAGADVSLNLFSKTLYAGIVVLSFPDFEEVDYALYKGETTFPYIPGLLSFREIPALVECWKALKTKPDLVMVDGQGIAHPRRLGIATHFGILTQASTIGCAKNLLTGEYEEPESEAGSFSLIYDKKAIIGDKNIKVEKEVVGYAFRSKTNVKPIFISPGFKISLEESLEITRQCIKKHRLPEPTRLAHELVNKFRKGELLG